MFPRLFRTFQLKDGDPRKCLSPMVPPVGLEIHLKMSMQGLTEQGRHSKDVEVPGSSR